MVIYICINDLHIVYDSDYDWIVVVVRADHAGRSAQWVRWKVQIILQPESQQQLVDCDHECDPEEAGSCDTGCNGGLMNGAFKHNLKSGFLMREKDYPFTGTDKGTCKFDKKKIVASVHNFSVISLDEDQIAANLVKNGPLIFLFGMDAVAINAVYMQTYVGGVPCPYIRSKQMDLGVLLVGYGEAGYAPIRMKEKPYWITKNSWGETWGESGYYKICKGRNVCGVDSMVSTVAAIHPASHERRQPLPLPL